MNETIRYKDPLITIGITNHNAKDTIQRAILSACNQTWSNLEIIIVDDFSYDDSVSIIQKQLLKDSRIKLIINNKNMGYPYSLNTIVNNAKGEFVIFFDDDDHSDLTRVEQQYNKLISFYKTSKNSNAVCYSDRKVFVNDQEDINGYVKAIGRNSPEPYGTMVADYILWHHKEIGYCWGEFGSCTLMAPISLLKKFPFDITFHRCAEWDFAIQLAFDNVTFLSVDRPLVTQYKTLTSDKSGNKPLHYTLKIKKKYKNYLISKKLYFGAIFLAYSRFYYFRKKHIKSRLFLIFACLISPKILSHEISKRLC